MPIRVSKQLPRGGDKDRYTIPDEDYHRDVTLNLKRGQIHYLLVKTLARVQRGKGGKVNGFRIAGTDKFKEQIYTKGLLDAQKNAIDAFWADSVLYRIGGRKRLGRQTVVFVYLGDAMLSFFQNVNFGDGYQVFAREGNHVDGEPIMAEKEIRITKANGVGTSMIQVHRAARVKGNLIDALPRLNEGFTTAQTVRDLFHIARRINGVRGTDGSITFDATRIPALNDALNQASKYVRTEVHAEPSKKKKSTRKGPRQGTGFNPVSTKSLNEGNISWLEAIRRFKREYAAALRARGVPNNLISDFELRNITSADIMAMMWFDLTSSSDIKRFDQPQDVLDNFKALKDKGTPNVMRDEILLDEQRIVKEYGTILKEGGIQTQKQRSYDRSNKKKTVPKARTVAKI